MITEARFSWRRHQASAMVAMLRPGLLGDRDEALHGLEHVVAR